MVSPGARGLFQRAIVQSGTFALNQQPLATAEAAGETFAAAVGCPDQTAPCLRSVPVSALVSNFSVAIPGVIDGSILTQPIGRRSPGQFARVPVINGITQDEENCSSSTTSARAWVRTYLCAPPDHRIESTVRHRSGSARRSANAGHGRRRPCTLSAYPMPDEAFSLLVSDASFACPALQVDRWTAARGVPTYAYQFNDDAAPGFGHLAARRRTGQNSRS